MYTLWLLPLHKRLKEKSIEDDGKIQNCKKYSNVSKDMDN